MKDLELKLNKGFEGLIFEDLHRSARALAGRDKLYSLDKESFERLGEEDREIIATYQKAKSPAVIESLEKLYSAALAREQAREKLDQTIVVGGVVLDDSLLLPVNYQEAQQHPSLMENLSAYVFNYLLANKVSFEQPQAREGLVEIKVKGLDDKLARELNQGQPAGFDQAKVDFKVAYTIKNLLAEKAEAGTGKKDLPETPEEKLSRLEALSYYTSWSGGELLHLKAKEAGRDLSLKACRTKVNNFRKGIIDKCRIRAARSGKPAYDIPKRYMDGFIDEELSRYKAQPAGQKKPARKKRKAGKRRQVVQLGKPNPGLVARLMQKIEKKDVHGISQATDLYQEMLFAEGLPYSKSRTILYDHHRRGNVELLIEDTDDHYKGIRKEALKQFIEREINRKRK